jgi:diguanylate cyclase (GGDEF)-like protein
MKDRVSSAVAPLVLGIALLAGPAAHGAPSPLGREIHRQVSHHPKKAAANAAQALAQAQAAGDKAAQIHALRLLTMARQKLEEYEGLDSLIDAGLALARERRDAEAECAFLVVRIGVERNAGRLEQALATADRVMALARQHELDDRVVDAMLEKALIYHFQNRRSDALALANDTQKIAEATDNRFAMTHVLAIVAASYSFDRNAGQSAPAKLLELHQRALSYIDPQVYRTEAAQIYHNIGKALQMQQRNAEARRAYADGMALTQELGYAVGNAIFAFRLAELARNEQSFPEALGYYDEALPVFRQSNNARFLFEASIGKADALAGLGRQKEALTQLQDAHTAMAAANALLQETRYHAAAARIYARLNDYEKAYGQMQMLTNAEGRVAEAANAKLAEEYKVRFDVHRKEADNAVLRAKQQEAESRSLAVALALTLTLFVLGGLAFYARMQIKQKRRFADLAMRDELTGVRNRRSIMALARSQFATARANATPLCVAILDIDHFKSINDRLGHDVGDAVLTAFAQSCQRQLRSNDGLGRTGGEEFLLVMPGMDTAEAQAVFARLREGLQVARRDLPDGLELAFSMGVAKASLADESVDGLIKRADQALYRAKHRGRDRCETDEAAEQAMGQAASGTATAQPVASGFGTPLPGAPA